MPEYYWASMRGKVGATFRPPRQDAPLAFPYYWAPINGQVGVICRPPVAVCTSGIYQFLGIDRLVGMQHRRRHIKHSLILWNVRQDCGWYQKDPLHGPERSGRITIAGALPRAVGLAVHAMTTTGLGFRLRGRREYYI